MSAKFPPDSGLDTRLTHAGRDPAAQSWAVNPPAYRASTILAPTVEALHGRKKRRFDEVSYGRFGTPTSFAFEEAVAAAEGGYRAIATQSGLAAITCTLTALLKAGDHILVTDSAYFPTRNFCNSALAALGVETTYYDPLLGSGIAELLRPNTRVVFTESPGSQTFEVQDIPAIAAAAHAAGALVVMDNTWGFLSFRPFDHGVDVSLQAATKYIVGHSDAMLGAITCADQALFERIKTSAMLWGYAPGSEEAWLGLRGIRTAGVRLRQQFAAGLRIAQWLEQRPEVARVLHPALPSDPGHALWQRDFSGGCGLFGVELARDFQPAAVHAMLDGYDLFSLGYSWGGFESLVVPTTGDIVRVASPDWAPQGYTLRYHVGLEDEADLIADLDRGFARLRAAT